MNHDMEHAKRCSHCEKALSPEESHIFLIERFKNDVTEGAPEYDVEHYFHSHLCLAPWAQQVAKQN